ncbi:MAG: response regulator [Deltaproteobacteria bacterium]|nr:response regulator [Deltaproteobacteria bacterium]
MTLSNGWKIVLIDDEKDIRDVITVTLEDAGYNVMTAENGEAGVRLCREISPQIVITDIRMPKMDGIQVLKALKSAYPDIEVIVVTAFGEIEIAIQALQLDASDFVTKPINDEALHMALKRAQHRYTVRKELKDHAALLEKENAQTTEELIKTISFQRNLIESSMDGILGCDEKGIVVTYNKSMERMLGFSKGEVLNKMSFSRFFLPEDDRQLKEKLVSESFGGPDRLFLYETNLLNHNKEKVPVQVSATVLSDQAQEKGLVCFFRDLREIHKLEREITDQARILHQDKMMSLGRLAASVVHEINNPLFGILNYLHLMDRILKRGSLSDDQREKFQRYLDIVENETSRCSQIISSLLTFSRKSSPSFDQVQIEELLNRCSMLSQHKLELSNINLVQSVEPGTPSVYGDFNQLQQCLFNLIFNAIDAMPNGGNINIEGRYDSARQKVIVTVKDSGPGISRDDLHHIFEPFFTTKKEGYGVGVGLSTAYGIIERHNGSISVESKPGEGAAFILEFPSFKIET